MGIIGTFIVRPNCTLQERRGRKARGAEEGDEKGEKHVAAAKAAVHSIRLDCRD
jgi:hypothetical protein